MHEHDFRRQDTIQPFLGYCETYWTFRPCSHAETTFMFNLTKRKRLIIRKWFLSSRKVRTDPSVLLMNSKFTPCTWFMINHNFPKLGSSHHEMSGKNVSLSKQKTGSKNHFQLRTTGMTMSHCNFHVLCTCYEHIKLSSSLHLEKINCFVFVSLTFLSRLQVHWSLIYYITYLMGTTSFNWP